MQAFFSDDQLLHDPQQYMRVGRICKPADLPTRAEALMATLAARGIAVSAPPDAGRAALEQVHSTDYLDYLETAFERWRKVESFGLEPGIEVLPNMSPHGPRVGPCPSPSVLAQTGWYVGDLSCPIGPNTWRSVLRSAHAALAAAEAVLDGGSIAYALCRPSGHHAQRARAAGFCYVNNSAIAAATLRRRHARVAVLDIDAHHGDGTQQIFYERGDVLTISTHANPAGYYPWYTGYSHERGNGEGEGFNLNLPLAHGSGNAEFAQALDQATAAIERFQPQALVLPLGFDTYKDDPISVLKFDMEAFRLAGERVRALGLPTVVVQEGGYMVGAIGAALDAFLEGLRA
ncbi:histone deacetylase family protein [Variovorax guangxiensis]|uniref:Histone deacetylase family protein n=1 Tax=Variovorax guangxiensis TaxID=1775474 RepID=A0A433MHW8_9BURK|nr:histone deacetylase family protein [Variovorax guangxiensis]RUR67651.1 histone deacetylase family protein [Variovorax guangxiensis]